MTMKLSVAGLVLLAGAPETTHGQPGGVWTVANLHPAGASDSLAHAAHGARQAGWANVDGVGRASLWSGTAASWVDLNPAGLFGSEAFAIHGAMQAGHAIVDGVGHASVWCDTADSWIDLHPAAASQSFALATDGGQQAGYASVDGQAHASLWTGTAASWIDLHPAAAAESFAFGTDGGQQAGYAFIDGLAHASLWSGTAASWLDLHPAGAAESFALATDGAQQVGSVDSRASLWSGTAASLVDLHPAGATASEARAVAGGYQAGGAVFDGVVRAGVWSGTAASWVDLSQFLPGGPDAWGNNYARGLWTDGTVTTVVGWGHNQATSRNEALMWTLSAPAPACVLDYNVDGVLNPDDLGDFITDYFTFPPVPGPGGYAIACPENGPPYTAGYRAAFTMDGAGQCNEPFPDNLGDYITAYFGAEGGCGG